MQFPFGTVSSLSLRRWSIARAGPAGAEPSGSFRPIPAFSSPARDLLLKHCQSTVQRINRVRVWRLSVRSQANLDEQMIALIEKRFQSRLFRAGSPMHATLSSSSRMMR